MNDVLRDFIVYTLATCIGMIMYDYSVKRWKISGYAEYVPSLEGFERMDIQAPDMTEYRRDTLERA